MAIVNGMWLKGSKKKLGGTVVYESGGRTIQRVLATEVRNPRTESQMSVRVRWANIVNLYKVLKPVMKYAFEYKKRYQSDYNSLMSVNVSHSPVFLTKQEAQQGASIIADYQITQGSLPRIEYVKKNTGWQSNIALTNDDMYFQQSVSDFTKEVLSNNADYRLGDQLSLVVLVQVRGDEEQVPYAQLYKNEVILDTNNNDRLINYWNPAFFDVVKSDGRNYLMLKSGGQMCASTFIHSRTVSGKTYVSSQKLMYLGSEEIVDLYSTQEQYDAAIKSYGSSEDAFLDSTRSEHHGDEETQLALMYIKDGSMTFTPDSRRPEFGQWEGSEIVAVFNQNVPSTGWTATCKIQNKSENFDVSAISGNTIKLILDVEGDAYSSEEPITSISLVNDNITYSITFPILNEDTIGGLE